MNEMRRKRGGGSVPGGLSGLKRGKFSARMRKRFSSESDIQRAERDLAEAFQILRDDFGIKAFF